MIYYKLNDLKLFKLLTFQPGHEFLGTPYSPYAAVKVRLVNQQTNHTQNKQTNTNKQTHKKHTNRKVNEQSDNERKRGHKQTFAQSLYPVVKVGLMKQTSSAVNCYRVQNQELLTDKSP